MWYAFVLPCFIIANSLSGLDRGYRFDKPQMEDCLGGVLHRLHEYYTRSQIWRPFFRIILEA